MDHGKQSDRVSRAVQGDRAEEDGWRVISRFEDGYALGYSDGLSAGTTVGAIVAAVALFLLWAILK